MSAFASISAHTNKFLDITVGNLGKGIGFGAAYAARIPIAGAPIRALNEGIAEGYNRGMTKILANDFVAGRINEQQVQKKLGKISGDIRSFVDRLKKDTGFKGAQPEAG